MGSDCLGIRWPMIESLFDFLIAGFIILLTSIFSLFLLAEVRNLTTLSLLPLVNNCFSLSSFFQSLLYFLWMGAQFPQVKFLSKENKEEIERKMKEKNNN